MKNLNALILSAAIVPALALSTAALAEERDDTRAGEQSAGQQAAGEERSGQKAAGEQAAGEQRSGQQATGEQSAGEQLVSDQPMSDKPAGAFYADDVIGKTLKHRGSDEDVGEIQDLVIGEDGRVVGVVVTTGSFLGLGGQNIGLGWDQIEHAMEDDESVFYTDMDEEALRNAPNFERD